MTLNKPRVLVFASMTALACTVLLTSYSVAAKEGFKRPGGERFIGKMFQHLDTSDDELLQLDELTSAALAKAEKRFERKDTDDDGFLTFEEATANREPVDYSDIADDIVACVADAALDNPDIMVPDADKFTSPQDKFAAVDTSGDELIDLPEAQAQALAKSTDAFDAMDTDASGDVTLEEFVAFRASVAATRRAVRECIQSLTDEAL